MSCWNEHSSEQSPSGCIKEASSSSWKDLFSPCLLAKVLLHSHLCVRLLSAMENHYFLLHLGSLSAPQPPCLLLSLCQIERRGWRLPVATVHIYQDMWLDAVQMEQCWKYGFIRSGQVAWLLQKRSYMRLTCGGVCMTCAWQNSHLRVGCLQSRSLGKLASLLVGSFVWICNVNISFFLYRFLSLRHQNNSHLLQNVMWPHLWLFPAPMWAS